MTVYWEGDGIVLHHGNCVTIMAGMPEHSVDAITCDPPYELGFMGKPWDATGVAFDPETWRAALRVLKPGGHLIAFGGTRTWHRLAVAVEDAGFEIRDSIAWMYGSGFPKSLDVGKAIDKAAGAEREIVGTKLGQPGYSIASGGEVAWGGLRQNPADECAVTTPATPEAAKWNGWGTALKPAHEPIVVARKPLVGTVAANVLEHGTGALNIDATRIENADYDLAKMQRQTATSAGMNGIGDSGFKADHVQATYNAGGRWPANVILDSDQAAALDQQSGTSQSRKGKPRNSAKPGDGWGMTSTGAEYADQGGASRFFYVAKAPKNERLVVDGIAHPTVKPLTLMRWLVRLVTPPGGTVLDPFAGSGTTIEAAILEGFAAVGIEQDATYLPLIQERIRRCQERPDEPDEPSLFGDTAMTIVKQVTQIRCDQCLKAYIYPEGDITQYLTANDWVVDGQTHTCPWCARSGK